MKRILYMFSLFIFIKPAYGTGHETAAFKVLEQDGKKLAVLEDQLRQNDTKQSQAIARVQQQIGNQEAIESMQQQIGDQISELLRNVEGQNAAISRMQNQIDQLGQNDTKQSQAIESMQQQIGDQNARITGVQNQINQLDQNIAIVAMTKKISDQNARIIGMQNQINQFISSTQHSPSPASDDERTHLRGNTTKRVGCCDNFCSNNKCSRNACPFSPTEDDNCYKKCCIQ